MNIIIISDMANILELSSSQLKRAADLKDQIEALSAELAQLLGASVAPLAAPAQAEPKQRGPKKGGMSAEGRARIAAAQKARWAKAKAQKVGGGAKLEVPGKKRRISAAGRAAIIAAQKARWAKVKASK